MVEMFVPLLIGTLVKGLFDTVANKDAGPLDFFAPILGAGGLAAGGALSGVLGGAGAAGATGSQALAQAGEGIGSAANIGSALSTGTIPDIGSQAVNLGNYGSQMATEGADFASSLGSMAPSVGASTPSISGYMGGGGSASPLTGGSGSSSGGGSPWEAARAGQPASPTVGATKTPTISQMTGLAQDNTQAVPSVNAAAPASSTLNPADMDTAQLTKMIQLQTLKNLQNASQGKGSWKEIASQGVGGMAKGLGAMLAAPDQKEAPSYNPTQQTLSLVQNMRKRRQQRSAQLGRMQSATPAFRG